MSVTTQTVILCNACGKEDAPHEGHVWALAEGWVIVEISPVEGVKKIFHVCPDCKKMVLKTLSKLWPGDKGEEE